MLYMPNSYLAIQHISSMLLHALQRLWGQGIEIRALVITHITIYLYTSRNEIIMTYVQFPLDKLSFFFFVYAISLQLLLLPCKQERYNACDHQPIISHCSKYRTGRIKKSILRGEEIIELATGNHNAKLCGGNMSDRHQLTQQYVQYIYRLTRSVNINFYNVCALL